MLEMGPLYWVILLARPRLWFPQSQPASHQGINCKELNLRLLAFFKLRTKWQKLKYSNLKLLNRNNRNRVLISLHLSLRKVLLK